MLPNDRPNRPADPPPPDPKKVEEAPHLTDEDEAILDQVWSTIDDDDTDEDAAE